MSEALKQNTVALQSSYDKLYMEKTGNPFPMNVEVVSNPYGDEYPFEEYLGIVPLILAKAYVEYAAIIKGTFSLEAMCDQVSLAYGYGGSWTNGFDLTDGIYQDMNEDGPVDEPLTPLAKFDTVLFTFYQYEYGLVIVYFKDTGEALISRLD